MAEQHSCLEAELSELRIHLQSVEEERNMTSHKMKQEIETLRKDADSSEVERNRLLQQVEVLQDEVLSCSDKNKRWV